MANLLERKLCHYPLSFINDIEISLLHSGSLDSRYSKIKRLIQQSKLLHIRRGLYAMTDELGHPQKTNSFVSAKKIYGPSYISLESALSYHGLIPEAVYTVTSACIKRNKLFHTPLGDFSYQRLPKENFYCGVEWIQHESGIFLLAKPGKQLQIFILL